MRRTAKIFMKNGSQAVRLPKGFQVKATEVFIRRSGEEIILSPRPTDWSAYFEEGPVASPTFMNKEEVLPVQERNT
jgi:antitoxin VapB